MNQDYRTKLSRLRVTLQLPPCLNDSPQRDAMAQHFRLAITSVWLILSVILLLVLLAPYLLPENVIMVGSSALQSKPHSQESCSLCGMTRAFIAISHGNFDEAVGYSDHSVLLYSAFLANVLLAGIFTGFCVRKYFVLRLHSNPKTTQIISK